MDPSHYIPDPELDEIGPRLKMTVDALADSLEPEDVPGLIDEVSRAQLEATFERIGASEGTLWIRDLAGTHLVPVLNTGPHADAFVLKHLQPTGAGIISMVFGTELPFAESNVHHNQQQDRTLDKALGVLTCAMIAVPFGFAHRTRGVLSAVKLTAADSSAPEPPPFAEGATIRMTVLAETLERFIDLKLLSACLGMRHA